MDKNDMKMLVSLAVSFIIVILMSFLTVLEIRFSLPMEPLFAFITMGTFPCSYIGWKEAFGKNFKFDDIYTRLLSIALFFWHMVSAVAIILLNLRLVTIFY